MTEPHETENEGVLQPKKPSLFRSSALMASGTMVSRILGFLRTALLLAALGKVGGVGEAFNIANTLPNNVYNLLASGILDAVLIPQIIRALRSKAGSVYVNRLLTAAGSILFGLTLVAMVAAPLLVSVFAPEFEGEQRSLAIAFSLWCLPQLFFYGLYNLWGEVLNARGIFGPYMWAPVVNNVVGIAGLAIFLFAWGPSGSTLPASGFTNTQFLLMASTATLGVVLQALILLIPLRNSGVKLRLDFRFKGTDFGSASKVAGWTFATLLISQIGVISTYQLANRAAAWAEATGDLVPSIQAYSTAFMIYMVPQSLIAVTLATAIFTRLANSVANGDYRAVAKDYHTGVRLITMLSMAAAAFLIVAAVPIMQLITPGSGPEIASIYGSVLVALVLGIPSTGIILLSQRVFFAFENAKPVFLMGIVPTVLQVIVGWGVFFVFQDSPQWWTVGAAAGETVCRIVQAFIAIIWTAHMVRTVNAGRVIASYLLYFFAFVASALPAWGVLHLVSPISTSDSGIGRFVDSLWKILLVLIVVAIVFVIVLRFIDPKSTKALEQALVARLPARFRKDDDEGTSADSTQNAKDGEPEPLTSQLPLLPRLDLGADSPADEGQTRDDWDPNPPAWEDIVLGDDASRTLARALGSPDLAHTGQIPLVRGAQDPRSFDGPAVDFSDSLLPEPSGGGWPTASAPPPPPPAAAAPPVGGIPLFGNTPDSGYHSSQSSIPSSKPASWAERTNSVDNQAKLKAGSGAAAASRGRFNPTVPALILGSILVVVGIVFAITTLRAPMGTDLGALIPDAQSEQSGEQSPEAPPAPTPVLAAPVIGGVTVFSWQNLDADHPELAGALIDGDPETLWYSLYYDFNEFIPEETIALLVKLQEEAVVNEIVLDVIGSGGELVVRAAEGGNPRAGAVLAASPLNGQTVIKLTEPTKLSEIGLDFKSLPIDDEGVARAKISGITVR